MNESLLWSSFSYNFYMPFKRITVRKFLVSPFLICILVWISSYSLSLGQSPADMPLRQVITEAQALIGQGDFAGASPLLDELEGRFENEKDPEVEKILQQEY